MSVEITLKRPFTVSGVERKSLTLREPLVRDLLIADKASGTDAEKEVRLLANLCELSPEEMQGLHLADYQQVQKAYQAFLS